MRFSTIALISLCFLLALVQADDDVTCGVGYERQGSNKCRACPDGQSSNGQGGKCQNCPANTSSQSGGPCITCEDGKGSRAGGSCEPCAAGKYSKNGSGCLNCQNGYISAQGATGCSPCAPGYYANEAHTICQKCAAGTYQDASGQSTCISCPKGYFQQSTGQTSCTICPCGTYKSTTQAISCDSCGTGSNGPLTSYQGSTSSGQCFAPKSGMYKDQNNCPANCPAGTYSSNGQVRECTPCGPNSVATSGSPTCTPCGMGTAPDATKVSCTPTSTYKPRRRNVERVCPMGYRSCEVIRGRHRTVDCVDVSSDLTSCGGCPGTSEAVDCTAFDPLAAATCDNGTCSYTCPKGYKLTPSGCHRKTNAERLRVQLGGSL